MQLPGLQGAGGQGRERQRGAETGAGKEAVGGHRRDMIEGLQGPQTHPGRGQAGSGGRPLP